MAIDLPETPPLDQLVSLVDHRTEEPDVEYKAWMDLSEPEKKSSIAKHLCALSNYGGGWLVFGIADDGSHDEPHPGDLKEYRQDIINGIVSRYLHPAFHCNVYFVQSGRTGKEYPIVRVPPHGAQPVCAKTDGPLINKSRVGVTKGIHYIRVPGPKSEPIDSPELWRTLLHRCVLLEREQLIASIDRLFERPSVASSPSPLSALVDDTIARWEEVQREGWLVDPKVNRIAFGFQFFTANQELVQPISLAALKTSIRESSNAADAESEGLPTFDMYYGGLVAPSVILFQNVEDYEAEAVYEDGSYLFAPSLSRALVNGSGAEVRPYHEDTDWVQSLVHERSSRTWPVGTRLSPRFQASKMLGFVAFVRNISKAFPDADRVRLVADYRGLADRILGDTRATMFYSRTKQSVTEQRRVEIEAPVEKLIGIGASEVAVLILNPILRLFDGWEINGEFVRRAGKDL